MTALDPFIKKLLVIGLVGYGLMLPVALFSVVTRAAAGQQQQEEERITLPFENRTVDAKAIQQPNNTTVTKFVDDTGLVIDYVPPGWAVIDHDNTSPKAMKIKKEQSDDTTLSLCPPYSVVKKLTEYDSHAAWFGANLYRCDSRAADQIDAAGQIVVHYKPNIEQDEDILRMTTQRDPSTDLLVMREITGQDVFDADTTRADRVSTGIVESKTVPINITTQDQGQQQTQGLMVLLTDREFNLVKVALYFTVDTDHDNKNVTSYEMSVWGPGFVDNFYISDYFQTTDTDLRGEPIKVHGIGLDSMPAVMDDAMKILKSVSISTAPAATTTTTDTEPEETEEPPLGQAADLDVATQTTPTAPTAPPATPTTPAPATPSPAPNLVL